MVCDCQRLDKKSVNVNVPNALNESTKDTNNSSEKSLRRV